MSDEPRITLSKEFCAKLDGVAKTVRAGGHIAVYQNQALDSSYLGRLQALLVGPGYTFSDPPKTLAGQDIPVSWAYCHVGYYDPASRSVVKDPPGMPHPQAGATT